MSLSQTWAVLRIFYSLVVGLELIEGYCVKNGEEYEKCITNQCNYVTRGRKTEAHHDFVK